MEVRSIRNRIGGNWTSQLLATRRGALTIAGVSAILAAVLLYAFVQHYRKAPVAVAPGVADVFVATHYIPAGTPESIIAAEGLLKREQVPANQAVLGAISDPSAIVGDVSSAPIAAGQQLAIPDFSHSTVTIAQYLNGEYRAIAIPLDPSHGLTNYVAQGSDVDIMVNEGDKTVVIAQDVPVLANASGDVILKVTDVQALELAGASDTSKLWLTMRPSYGSKDGVQIGSQEKNL